MNQQITITWVDGKVEVYETETAHQNHNEVTLTVSETEMVVIPKKDIREIRIKNLNK